MWEHQVEKGLETTPHKPGTTVIKYLYGTVLFFNLSWLQTALGAKSPWFYPPLWILSVLVHFPLTYDVVATTILSLLARN